MFAFLVPSLRHRLPLHSLCRRLYQKMCIKYICLYLACPSSPIQTYKDSVYNRCVQNCSTGPSYFAYNVTNSCVQYCPSPYWADENLMVCQMNCPIESYYQIDGSERTCVDTCYPNYYADLNRTCVAASSCPSSPIPYFADDSTGKCVTSRSLSTQAAPSLKILSETTQLAGAYSIVHLDLLQKTHLDYALPVTPKICRLS